MPVESQWPEQLEAIYDEYHKYMSYKPEKLMVSNAAYNALVNNYKLTMEQKHYVKKHLTPHLPWVEPEEEEDCPLWEQI